MKERVFWVCIGVFAATWLANFLYADAKRLDGPVFLDHYVETTLPGVLTFYYLTDKDDNSRVSYVNMDGVSGYADTDYNVATARPVDVQSFRHYVLRKVEVMPNEGALEQLSAGEDFTFTEMDVFFEGYRDVKAEIGKVTVRKQRPKDFPLRPDTTGYDNPGVHTERLHATEKLEVHSIGVTTDRLLGLYTFELSAVKPDRQSAGDTWMPLEDAVFPFSMEPGEKFEIRSHSLSKESVDFIEGGYDLSGATAGGESFTRQGFNFYIQPYLTEQDVQAILKRKGVRGQ